MHAGLTLSPVQCTAHVWIGVLHALPYTTHLAFPWLVGMHSLETFRILVKLWHQATAGRGCASESLHMALCYSPAICCVHGAVLLLCNHVNICLGIVPGHALFKCMPCVVHLSGL